MNRRLHGRGLHAGSRGALGSQSPKAEVWGSPFDGHRASKSRQQSLRGGTYKLCNNLCILAVVAIGIGIVIVIGLVMVRVIKRNRMVRVIKRNRKRKSKSSCNGSGSWNRNRN